jgi:hypothetical protein
VVLVGKVMAIGNSVVTNAWKAATQTWPAAEEGELSQGSEWTCGHE